MEEHCPKCKGKNWIIEEIKMDGIPVLSAKCAKGCPKTEKLFVDRERFLKLQHEAEADNFALAGYGF